MNWVRDTEKMIYKPTKDDLCSKLLTIVESISDGVFAVDMEMKRYSPAVVESQRTAITDTLLLPSLRTAGPRTGIRDGC